MCTVFVRVLLVVVLCAHALAVPGDYGDWKRSSAMRYCGRHLSDVIRLACGGRYNTYNTNAVKKSGEQTSLQDEEYKVSMMDPEMDEGDLNSVLGELPLRPRSVARALSPRVFRRVLRGAHDECCLKPCTHAEISTYCARD
ncbi:LIRP-like [Ischnura elegans]|uniref:LIRP-like n=1 Tax=Ischnura elegans TaxID=197161 RepID=UPI001ED88CE8|nr:LIRP-like [Ischnura elegans]